MKKIVYLLFFISCNISAQNVISVSFQPIDMGMGLRYDREFRNFGLYISQAKGDFRADEIYLNDHIKTSLGVTLPLSDGNISLGVSHHLYGKNNIEDKRVLCPYSFEFGGSSRIGRINTGVRFDFIKGESVFDLGYAF